MVLYRANEQYYREPELKQGTLSGIITDLMFQCAVADFYTAKVDTDLEINIYIFFIISVEQKHSQCRFRL